MRYFREGREKFDLPEENNQNGSLKDPKKKAKKKKSGASDGDWTWKDRVDMVKWTDRMITVSSTRYRHSTIYTVNLGTQKQTAEAKTTKI